MLLLPAGYVHGFRFLQYKLEILVSLGS